MTLVPVISGCQLKIDALGSANALATSSHTDRNEGAEAITPISISPATPVIMVGNSITLTASDGIAPYTFALTSGNGTIGATSGIYTAPGSSGTATVTVTDSVGTQGTVTITINGPLAISDASITITAQSGQTHTFSATGGISPYSYSIVSGGGSIDPATGIYTAAASLGTTTVRVTDSLGNISDASVANISLNTNGTVHATVTDGTSIFLGGSFTSVFPYPAPLMIAVDAASGSPRLGFDLQSGFNGLIHSIVRDGDWLFVGGEFTSYRGASAVRLAKINALTGALDTTFTQSTGANGTVKSIVVSGSSIFIGGDFTTYRGTTAQRLARIDSVTGALDTTFTQSTGASATVSTIALSGSSLYIGGNFTAYRGTTANYLTKIDATTGAIDTTFTQATGPNDQVYQIVASGTDLYVAGEFATYRGSTAKHIAKINATSGVLDTTFTQSTGPNFAVTAIALSGSSLYLTGYFTTYRGSAVSRLVKIDTTNGDLDAGFSPATGPDNLVRALRISGNSLYLGGDFTSYRGTSARYLAKVNALTGNLDTTFTQALGPNSPVWAVAISDSTLYAGGYFTAYRGIPAPYLAKVNAATHALDTSFTQSTGPNSTVYALLLSGTDLYLGGAFSTYRGSPANYVAKINASTGALDTSFTQAAGPNTNVHALALSGTNLYIGGEFSTYRGTTAQRLAKISSTNGNLDTTFTQSTGASAMVYTLAISGTDLYLGGWFTSYRGTAANYLAKVDATSGVLDTTFTQSTGTNNAVRTLAISGSNLYLGGDFTTYRSTAVQRLAKVDASSGVLDTTFTQATGASSNVYSLALSGSSLYLGGFFSTYRGVTAPRLAKVDATSGALDTTFTQTSGPNSNSYVRAIATSGSAVYIGGDFTQYRGTPVGTFLSLDANNGNLLR